MSGDQFYYSSSPCLIGPDWFPSVAGVTTLNGDLVCAANVVTVTETEDVPAFGVDLSSVALQSAGQGSGWDVEVWDVTDLPDPRPVAQGGDLIGYQYVPTEDVRNVDAYAWGSFAPGGTNTNIYRGLDSTSLTPGTWPNTGQPVDNDEFVFPIFGTGYEATFRFDTDVASDHTGKHVTRVGLGARIQELVDLAFVAGMTITPYLNIGGVRWFGPTFTVNGESPGGHIVTASWYCNPATRSAWRVADVAEFATGGDSSAGWIVRPTGSANNLATILQGWLEVDNVGSERRLAIGSLTDPVEGWNTFTAETLTGGTFTKSAGDTLAVIMRRRAGEGSIGVRYLDSGDALPVPIEGTTVAVDGAAFVPYDLPDTLTRAWALAFVTGASTVSVDTQPYCGLDSDQCVVSTAGDLVERFVADASDTYAALRALVRVGDADPTGDLDVTLERVSDNNVMASWTITYDDLVRPQRRWQIVDTLDASPSALTAGAAYRLRFSSTTTDDAPWFVQVMDGNADGTYPVGLEDATWWGDEAWVESSNGYPSPNTVADVAATIHTEVAALNSLTATASAEVDGVAYVTIDVDVPAVDCDGVDHVEVQRRDTVDTTWRTVARLADGTTTWDDYEARRNVASDYRARIRRADQAVSAWSAVDSATPTLTGCGLVLASNVDGSLTEWFDDTDGGQTTFRPIDNTTIKQFAGRPYSAGFAEAVDRGWEFDRTLLVGATNGATTGTPAPTTPDDAWGRVLSLTRNTALPYVAVLDRAGQRWFAVVVPGEATRTEPAGAYQMKVTVTEATRIPYPVDV